MHDRYADKPGRDTPYRHIAADEHVKKRHGCVASSPYPRTFCATERLAMKLFHTFYNAGDTRP